MASRLDVALTELQLAPSRSKAQELIKSGNVEVLVQSEWRTILDVAYSVDVPNSVDNPDNLKVRIKPNEILKYVSRGGLKLQGALEHCGLNVQGFICLDVGQSTGGFTHCLLEHGATQVFGFDVGHGQLHEKLRGDPRVTSLEGVNIRDLGEFNSSDSKALPFKSIQLAVVDVSFISLKIVFPVLKKLLSVQTLVLALVKPQFELESKDLNKNGIVKDDLLLKAVEAKICDLALENQFKILDYFACDVRGQDGNQEFFIYAKI